MSFCKIVMRVPRRFVFLIYVDDRAIYEFREAERRYADKIFGSGLPGVYWPYIEG